MAGTVKEKRVTVGEYIRNGTFLVSIIRADMLKLSFTVTEKMWEAFGRGRMSPLQWMPFPGGNSVVS